MRRRLRPGILGALALAALLATGCITRSVRETVFEDAGVEVRLRSEKKGREILPKGYDHPKVIAPVRLAHILARVDLRLDPGEGGDREPALATDVLYTVADGVSEALAKATPDQELVVMVTENEKRFGIFDHEYLTSFLAYVKDDLLYLHFHRYHWEITKELHGQKIREPRVGEQVMDFRVVPARGMNLVDSQAVAVFWRDDVFKRPQRTRILPGGRVVRREILMESPPEGDGASPAAEEGAAEEPPAEPLPPNLSPEALRALADLEEARREGEITEVDYQLERSKILSRGR